MLTSESNYLDIDLDYLERIVFKTCLEDEVYLNSIIDNLNYKFFKNKNFQQIIKIIQALYKKNKKRPSRTELELYLNTDQLKEHYEKSKTVINALIDDNFGKKWMSKNDSTYIPANKNFKISSINNELTIKEAKLIKN